LHGSPDPIALRLFWPWLFWRGQQGGMSLPIYGTTSWIPSWAYGLLAH
jgi:hypothetical protein